MSLANTLDALQDLISSKENDIEEKIQRLKQASRELSVEQNQLLQEITQIIDPNLGREWTGKRATRFESYRMEAYLAIKDIGIEAYDRYKQEIENKITSLEQIQLYLQTTKAIACEAEHLVKSSEDAAVLEEKVSELKRRLG